MTGIFFSCYCGHTTSTYGGVRRTDAGKRDSECALAVTYEISDGKDRRTGTGKRGSECALAVTYEINDGNAWRTGAGK